MIPSFSPSRSLSNKLIIFFVAGAVAAMLTLTLINMYISSTTMLETTRERIKAQSDTSVDHIESYLAERLADTRVVASLPEVHEMLSNNTSKSAEDNVLAILNELRYAYDYSAISLVDATGTVVLSSDSALVGQNRSQRPEIQRALKGFPTISDVSTDPQDERVYFHVTRPVNDAEGAILGVIDTRNSLVLLDSLIGADTGRSGVDSYSVLLDEHLIRISVPAYMDMRFHPSVALTDEVVQQMSASNRFGSETRALLNAGEYLTSGAVEWAVGELHKNQEKAVFFSGSTESTGEPGESMVQRIEMTSWYYVHHVPRRSFYAPVRKQAGYALLVMVGVIAISILLVIWFARRTLSRPLTTLLEAAQAIAAGDLNRRLALHRRDEIGTLATSFNIMADALQSRIETEQQAREDAKRLQQAEAQGRRMLEHTVDHYLAFVQQIGNGNLSQHLTVQHNGALGHLGNGLNQMNDNLRTIIHQIKDASTDIAAAAGNILSATAQQSASTSEQSAAISETTATVEEIRTIAQQTSQQATVVAEDSQSTLQMTRQGTQMVEETISSMERMSRQMDSIAQTILALSEQTEAIGAITETVGSLADQSNLLALNAAIEAARAGDQGKSFAVVAQHVRELAERSKAATIQVQEILGQIEMATKIAVKEMEEGKKGVEVGLNLSQESGQVIRQIATEVEKGAQANIQMAAAAHQQTAGIEQIGQAMQSIQQTTHETLMGMRQAESAARALHTLAQSLRQTTADYNVSEDGDQSTRNYKQMEVAK